jgi:hypothetical protein
MKTVDRVVVRSGLVLALAVVAVTAACVPKGPIRSVRPYAVPVPLQLQTAVAIDNEGNQVLVGSFAGRLQVAGTELVSAGATDIFVVKTDKAGVPVFAPERFGGSGNDSATGVALDAGGGIIVAGTFQEQATFGGQRLRAEVRIPEQRAVFVARLGNKGEVQWVKQVGMVNVPTQVSVALAPDHSITVGTSSSGAVESPNGQATLGSESVVLTHLTANGDLVQGKGLQLLSLPIGCSHSLCQGDWSSPPLAAGCGMYGCTATICLPYEDSYCCTTHWDPICVAEMTTIAQRRCDCAGICAQGLPFYPDACDLARSVIAADSSCGTTTWGPNCVTLAVSFGAKCP